jgi:N-acetylglucosamine kinase-like BadF-type ATPase
MPCPDTAARKDHPTRRRTNRFMSVSIVLGIDGGQTSTTAAICDLDGRLLGVGRAGPSNHVWEPGGVARAQRAVAKAVAGAARQARLKSPHFRASFLGMTGGSDRTRQVVRECLDTDRFRMEGDTVTALACVTLGEPGVVVIAGTGTIAYGENDRGETAVASGWGWLIGDEGAGFWIAKQALAAACRACDGRGEPTVLRPALTAAAGVDDLWELHRLIYSETLSRAEVAALAAVVPEAAAAGDAAARRILREAGRELGLSAGVVAQKLGLHEGRVTVGMVGGVFRGSDQVRRAFRREVRRHAPQAVFAAPHFAPVIGAVLLALRLAEVQVGAEVLTNLKAASAAVGAK